MIKNKKKLWEAEATKKCGVVWRVRCVCVKKERPESDFYLSIKTFNTHGDSIILLRARVVLVFIKKIKKRARNIYMCTTLVI